MFWEPVKEHNEIYKLLGIKQRKEYILKTAIYKLLGIKQRKEYILKTAAN